MKIIIVGCGKIGTAIISNLAAEGHDITAVDIIPEAVESITNMYDVMGLCGNGADYETFKEADIENTQLFIAVTGSDELNMLCCYLAKRLGAENTIARIRNPEYNDNNLGFMCKQLELSMPVNPELLTAKELFNILRFPAAVKIESFSRRYFEMIELKLSNNSALDGIKLSKLREKFSAMFLVCAVQREDEVFIPSGNFELKSGDKIALTASPAEMIKLLKEMGVLRKQAKTVMILGGSRTAYYLAKMLTAVGVSVKIIEKDLKICQEMSSLLPGVVVIQGDGTQHEQLAEEGLSSVDALVSLTGIDEENILVSIYASMNNVPKVISKVSRDELASMAIKMGLDCIVSPQEITSNVMLQYARALENSMGSSVETLYKIMDGKAEALEFIVQPGSKTIGTPLKDLDIKNNILIAGIVRGRKTIIPSGNDAIYADDHVIILSSKERLQDLDDILR